MDDLFLAVRAGHSAVLVVVGEPGIGKTALLDHAAATATGLTVVRSSGIEPEQELPFAALHRLCSRVLDRLERLPARQRNALGVAFGLVGGDAPHPMAVGLAVLALFAETARDTPLVCIVDDCQWLDSASAETLGFLARRIREESVLLLLATRDCADNWRHLPVLRLNGLDEAEAHELLGSVLQGPMDVSVRDRIVAETRGNPLALLELPRGLSPARLAGGFGTLSAVPGHIERMEAAFRARDLALPGDAQRLLLIAAAEPLGSPALLWQTAKLLGIGRRALTAVEESGLLRIDERRVVFRHPLARSAVYRAATVDERSAVHRALAEVTDPDTDPDRRAWHRAQAALTFDAAVAAELERSAGRAHARGGAAAAGAFLARSAELTRDPSLRAVRQLAAAESTLRARGFDAALNLANAASAGPLESPQRARLQLLRGRIAFARRFGDDAPRMLLGAARQFEAFDAGQAREVYLEVLSSALTADQLGESEILDALARASAGEAVGAARPCDLLLNGLCAVVLDDDEEAWRVLKKAVSALRGPGTRPEHVLRWHWLAGHAARLLWDFESWEFFSERLLTACRADGVLSTLPVALNTRAGACLVSGRFGQVEVLVAEGRALQEATGGSTTPYAALGLAVFRGQEAEVKSMIATIEPDAKQRGEGAALVFTQWASAMLDNSLGRYDAAFKAAWAASADARVRRFGNWALVEMVEAAVRSGRKTAAWEGLDRLARMTRAGGGDWAVGIESRTRALLSEGKAAEDLYREAIDRLSRSPLRPDHARARLLYGEWLRRCRRHADAREQLRSAVASFDELGMEAFAERARVELSAAGASARRGGAVVARFDGLSPQEEAVSRMAAEGASNQEIAMRLFISTRTVEYHLHKAFRKLGVCSRTQLAGFLRAQASPETKSAGPQGYGRTSRAVPH